MTPTREELARLAAKAESWPYETGYDPPPLDCERISELLRAYPLPPEDGERERLAEKIRSWYEDPIGNPVDRGSTLAEQEPTVADYLRAAALLRQPPAPVDDADRSGLARRIEQFVADRNLTDSVSDDLTRAVTLLRQPLAPPAAGVSKEAVCSAAEAVFRVCGGCSACGSRRRGRHNGACRVGKLTAARSRPSPRPIP